MGGREPEQVDTPSLWHFRIKSDNCNVMGWQGKHINLPSIHAESYDTSDADLALGFWKGSVGLGLWLMNKAVKGGEEVLL